MASKTNKGNGGATGPDGKGIFDHAIPEGAAKKVSEVLGEITWLMSQSPLHKRFFIEDLEWFVMTPVLLQQFRIFYAKDRPLGVVFWATVSDEVEAMLKEGTTRLRPQDWKSAPSSGSTPASGSAAGQKEGKLWLVEAIAPFGGAEEMLKDLKAKVFPDKPLHYLATTAAGKEVRVI